VNRKKRRSATLYYIIANFWVQDKDKIKSIEYYPWTWRSESTRSRPAAELVTRGKRLKSAELVTSALRIRTRSSPSNIINELGEIKLSPTTELINSESS